VQLNLRVAQVEKKGLILNFSMRNTYGKIEAAKKEGVEKGRKEEKLAIAQPFPEFFLNNYC